MIRGLWTPDTVGWLLVAAGVPVAVAMGVDQGAEGVLRLGICLAVVVVWQVVFRMNMGVAPAPATAITALAVAVVAPMEVPLWQIALAVSFGVVIGELIFGGWGRNFLSPGVVALAFLSLSMPNATFFADGIGLALAIAPGTALLLLTGILPVSVLLGFGAAFWLVALGLDLDGALIASSGTLVFVAVFLVADPVASATTPTGRWLYGGLAGMLTALLMTGTSTPQAAVFAALLAGLFAPLLDQIGIAVQISRRRTRHDRV